MRILVVIAHYFGPKTGPARLPTYGSQTEPISRLTGLNAAIVGLHRHFGPNRHMTGGAALPFADGSGPQQLDIVIATIRDRHLLSAIGIEPSTYSVEYIDDEPLRLQFHVPRLLRDRLGAYDVYGFIEDDLIIHDPAFFHKLTWFQDKFGPRALLAPTRFEMSASGIPAKMVIDPILPESLTAPFRRSGQRLEIGADWNGARQAFRLPANPHAGCYFLTEPQLAYWIRQPSFDDRDDSWIGPLESAATFSIGRVFDIYKSAEPDPFFVEIEHQGARYVIRNPPDGRRYGESPLLAIAQNAVRAASGPPGAEATKPIDPSVRAIVDRWVAQGTAVGAIDELDRLRLERLHLAERLRDATARLAAQAEATGHPSSQITESTELHRRLAEVTAAYERLERQSRSPRRLLKAFFRAVWANLRRLLARAA